MSRNSKSIRSGCKLFELVSGVEEVAYSPTGIAGGGERERVSLQGDNVANLYSKGDRAKLLNVHSWPRLLCPSHYATPIILPPPL